METFTVTVEPEGLRFECAPDQTLLQAGLAAGQVLPWSCRNGTCRSCLAVVTSGTVAHRIPWPGLSAEEKAEGCVLPCVAEPRSNVVLRYAKP